MARKPGLGKGLGALIPDNSVASSDATTEAQSSGPLRMVPVDSIRPNQFQPRKTFNDDSLKTLAASVAELGVLQPIIVRPVEGEPDIGAPLGLSDTVTAGIVSNVAAATATIAADNPLLTKPYRRDALARALRAALGTARDGQPGPGPH